MIRITKSNLRRFLVGVLALPSLALAADPQIAAFNDSPDPAIAGQVYSYEIRVDNNASDAATNTRLTVTVPSGAVFVSASPLSQNCAAVSATQVECNLGTLGANGLDVRVITMNWRATVAGLTTINATATVTADNDVNGANNTQLANTTVNAGANLALSMTDSPDPVAPGANVTYVLTASNAGPNSVADLTVTNNLPPSSTFVSATGSGWSCAHSAGTVTCSRSGPHAVGAAIPAITIVATATASSGIITNSASVTTGLGGVPDPDTADNTATAATTILGGADLQVTSKAVVSATPLVAGGNVTFRLTPRNAGPDVASTVSVTDVLPAGWTFVSAAGTNWSCSAAAQTVTCTRASMPVGATDNIDIVATAPVSVLEAGSPYTNSASISSAATTDPVPGNNSASVNVTVFRDGADLSLGKVKIPFAVSVGGSLTSTITVTNNGPRVATGPLRVVEVLTNETYVSGTGTGWTCAAFSANVIVCDHANGGGLAVGASLPALTISTTAIAAGAAVNTACTGSSLPSGVVGPTASPPNNIGGDPNTTNDCFTSNSVAVVGGGNADLAVASVLTTTPTGGDKLVSSSESSATFTAKITNSAGADATGTRIRYRIPQYIAGSTGVSTVTAIVGDINGVANGSTATFSCTRVDADGTCTQTGGALRVGDYVTIVVTATRPMGNTFGGTANFTVEVDNSVEFDLNNTNNIGSDVVTIDPIADVEVTGKTISAAAGPNTVLAGENATYVVSYRNNGPDATNDVSLSDSFSFFLANGTTANPSDPGLEVVAISSSRPGSSCSVSVGSFITPAAPTMTCSIGYMNAGEAHTVTLVVRPASQLANPTRIVRNTVTASVTTPAESPTGGTNGNNSQTATLTVLSNSIDLLVNKTDLVDPVPF